MIKAELIDYMGNDLTVVNAARVSFAKESNWETEGKLNERDQRLIRYLGTHSHISPFGHNFATFRCSAPIFVCRQLVKHKFLRWNEVSRRYVNDDPEFYQPSKFRSKSDDKKQGSGSDMDDPGYHMHNLFTQLAIESTKQYKYLLNRGVCEEQARMVLPQNTMTEWYWSGSMDAWADMCNLRLKEDTQYETRILAADIDRQLNDCWPVSFRALRNSA